MDNDSVVKWNARHDAFRTTTDFTDLLRIIACYYEMYSRACTFVGPWIAKQHGMMFIPPSREQIKEALGKDRPAISYRARSAFIESVASFLMKHKGKKTLITPSPSSHHSAQFPTGTFTITPVMQNKPKLRDDKSVRGEAAKLHKIELAGADAPIFIENLNIQPEQVQFLIVRPKLGRLGTPSTSRWEVLMFKTPHGYLVEHTDSELNPRWAGKM